VGLDEGLRRTLESLGVDVREASPS
jgi:hypothetical protein